MTVITTETKVVAETTSAKENEAVALATSTITTVATETEVVAEATSAKEIKSKRHCT